MHGLKLAITSDSPIQRMSSLFTRKASILEERKNILEKKNLERAPINKANCFLHILN